MSSHERLLALNGTGFAQVHPFVVEYQRAIERRARFAKLCIDAGVAQKRVELEERQGAADRRSVPLRVRRP